MHRRDSDMCSVRRGLARDFAGIHDTGCQFRHFVRDVQKGKTRQSVQPFTCRGWVTRACFVNGELREVELKINPPPFPPFPRNLLMAGNDQIAARP
jgi:hypothetical protein